MARTNTNTTSWRANVRGHTRVQLDQLRYAGNVARGRLLTAQTRTHAGAQGNKRCFDASHGRNAIVFKRAAVHVDFKINPRGSNTCGASVLGSKRSDTCACNVHILRACVCGCGWRRRRRQRHRWRWRLRLIVSQVQRVLVH